jgi:polysaccharide export outer membrane protein
MRCLAILAVMSLAGCASLPVSGPTDTQISRAAGQPQEPLPFQIVTLETLAALPPAIAPLRSSFMPMPAPPTDLIGPGDVLDVVIYEAGVSLFGGRSIVNSAQGTLPGIDPNAQGTQLPPMRVDDAGAIGIPFVGTIMVLGATTGEVEDRIRQGLRGMSQDPHVVVTIQRSITNSVMLIGEVATPGRLTLITNHETLSDAIALGGGYRGDARDLQVRVERKGQFYAVRMSELLAAPELDLPVYPGDRITLLNAPQSYAVLGAPNKVESYPLTKGRTTLADAVAKAGGPSPYQGNAAAVFVFRFVVGEDGAEEPVVYHVNMMKPGAYLLSQRFVMQDKDVVYVANARANQAGKMVQIIGQLFSPFTSLAVTTRNLTQ